DLSKLAEGMLDNAGLVVLFLEIITDLWLFLRDLHMDSCCSLSSSDFLNVLPNFIDSDQTRLFLMMMMQFCDQWNVLEAREY
ncbi:hypothetical protein WA026_006209, partial [Henosepilachna vigintioctopunctata]